MPRPALADEDPARAAPPRPGAPADAAAEAARDDDRFRSLLRFSSDWYWEQDEHFRFTANLRGFPERPGIRPESYVGKTRWEMPCFGVTEQQWAAHKAQLQAHQPFFDFEYLRPSRDGVYRWVSVSGEPAFDANGVFRGYRGIGKDVTERKQARQRRAIEHAVARILSESDALAEAMPRIIEAICETMGWDYGARWDYNERDQAYECAERWFRERLRGSALAVWASGKRFQPGERALVRRVLATGEPCWVLDLAADSQVLFAREALEAGLTGAFAFPIMRGGRVLGAVELFAPRIWPPDQALSESAMAIGRQIAQFIVRKQAEARYREVVERSPSAILVHFEGLIVFANRAAAKLLGAPEAAQLVGLSVFDLLHPEYRALARERVGRILEAGLVLGRMEMKAVRLDGSVVDIEVSSGYFVHEGRPAVLAIANDISQRKAAEQKILRLSNLYAALSQTNRAIMRLADPQALFEEVCGIAARLGGFSLAAVAMVDPASGWVRAVAAAGSQIDYIRNWRASIDPAVPEGRGLTGTALRMGETVVCNDVQHDERTRPWRAMIESHGLRAVANVPLRRSGAVVGALVLCAAERDFFDQQLIGLLVEMASNISFALDAMDREAQRRQAEERLAELAQYDVLTTLPNRSLFLDRLQQAMVRARRSGTMAGLMFFDLDRFKQINDTLGHAIGDRVLQVVAARLREHLREADTIARLGGDEFTLIVEGATDAASLGTVAAKVCEVLAAPMHIDGVEIFVSASVGITVYPRDATEVDELLKNADIAMYRAKQEGRNGYQFYQPEMSASASDRLYIEAGLRQALARDAFELYYQPVIEVRTGRVVGMEALLRWHADGGMVSPASFIPVAEETGLIVEIGRWVLDAACAQAAQWQREGFGPLLLTVNVSGRQFLHRDLFDVVAGALTRSGLPPAQLGLEITESMLVHQAKEVMDTLARLDELGVGLAIDDFGTGYSSLTYLKRFPVDAIKVDQSFVRDVITDPDDAAIVRAIVAMARSLGIGVTAEGVETLAQLELLQELGCDLCQGYLFSRPVPAPAFIEVLRAQRPQVD
jgi:diguanylate cyclase (GGDEF)-like protein/PAS domain S-box-containing protein